MTAHVKPIDTAKMSQHLRDRAIDIAARKVLVSRLGGSDQEADLTVPSNCNGYGRVRHFRQQTSPGWPVNPLPIVPACKALGLDPPSVMTAQVFQNAACAWRCWYCFVPYNLLSADPKRAEWLTAEDLVRLYRSGSDRPLVIDLSGGSPDLVPEWTPWMMKALADAGLDSSTFLWTDDNLSTTYLFDKLDRVELDRICAYRNYGRVCCFKGYDARSFAFNTHAAEADLDAQFEIMGRLLELGLDIYGYVTFTAPTDEGVEDAMARFVDRLQTLDPNLPLRMVPLEIREFSPVTPRMDAIRRQSLGVQQRAIRAWTGELERRYSSDLRAIDIASVPLSRSRGAR
jgi:uncharacterized Fe-S cluster-containing radical SAM superfamily protein